MITARFNLPQGSEADGSNSMRLTRNRSTQPSRNTRYAFTAKGVTRDGNKWQCSGQILHHDGYPFAAYESVAALVEQELRVRPDVAKGGVTLRKLKKRIANDDL